MNDTGSMGAVDTRFCLRVSTVSWGSVELLIHLIMGNFGLTFQIKVVSVCAELDIRGHKGGPCLVCTEEQLCHEEAHEKRWDIYYLLNFLHK